jgi:hypothetical protein
MTIRGFRERRERPRRRRPRKKGGTFLSTDALSNFLILAKHALAENVFETEFGLFDTIHMDLGTIIKGVKPSDPGSDVAKILEELKELHSIDFDDFCAFAKRVTRRLPGVASLKNEDV